MAVGYNKTQLNVQTTLERGIYHRDFLAHYMRWSHVLKLLGKERKTGRILDIGCGTGELMDFLYRNRAIPAKYVGVDVRDRTIKKLNEDHASKTWVEFVTKDIITQGADGLQGEWDYITSFEVVEHVGKSNVEKFLTEIETLMGPETQLLISTPIYDERVGAAGNHTYDCGDGNGVIPQELRYDELKEILERHFEIIRNYGTFASQKDIKPVLTEAEQEIYNELSKYYDTNILAIMFAPLHPEQSRNCLWVLQKKGK